jgi:hypothetical protein
VNWEKLGSLIIKQPYVECWMSKLKKKKNQSNVKRW